jgi:hypothetical protein
VVEQVQDTPRLADVYLWRNFATVGARANEYEVCVPFANDAGTLRYAVYAFREYVGGVLHMGKLREGLVARNTWHNDAGVSKAGTWSTTAHGAIAGPGTAAFSSTAGDTISATVSGHTLFVRAYTNVNGGFGIVSVDGDATAAHRLPAVIAGDFRTITNVADNGSGACRVTAAGHGLATGATILVEGVNGVAGANGTFTITSVDANTLDLQGSTFSGSYASGGSLGFFAQSDLGLRYVEFYDATGGSNFDESVPLAENFPDAAHTISIRVRGTARGGGVTGKRCYVTGFATVQPHLQPAGSNASFAYVREVSNLRAAGSYSSFASAIEFSPTGFSNYPFLGEVHANETPQGWEWSVDGASVSLLPGNYLRGASVRLVRSSLLTHPALGNASVAEKTAEYEARAGQYSGLVCRHRVRWLTSGTCRAAYHGMLHAGERPTWQTASRSGFRYVGFGELQVGPLTASDGSQHGFAKAGQIEFSDPRHTLRVRLTMPNASMNVNGWTHSEPLWAFVEDRNDGGVKAYLTRSSQAMPEPVAAGDVHEAESGWQLWRHDACRPLVTTAARIRDTGLPVGRVLAGGGPEMQGLALAGARPLLLARIEYSETGAPLDPLTIDAVRYTVSLLDPRDPGKAQTLAGHSRVELAPAEVFRADLVRDAAWDETDQRGYNFRWQAAGDSKPLLPTAGRFYRIEFEIVPRSGPQLVQRFRLRTV